MCRRREEGGDQLRFGVLMYIGIVLFLFLTSVTDESVKINWSPMRGNGCHTHMSALSAHNPQTTEQQ